MKYESKSFRAIKEKVDTLPRKEKIRLCVHFAELIMDQREAVEEAPKKAIKLVKRWLDKPTVDNSRLCFNAAYACEINQDNIADHAISELAYYIALSACNDFKSAKFIQEAIGVITLNGFASPMTKKIDDWIENNKNEKTQ